MTLLEAVHEAVEMRPLSEEHAEAAMRAILAGESTPALTASLLTALRMKGETVDELTGFARAMRDAAEPVPVRSELRPLLDTCGTGGGARSVFNISTAAALVAASAGIRIAKHGNRSISSQCGSADVLEALGVPTRSTPAGVAAAIEQVGIGFLFAPMFHGAMHHVQPVRLELKMRTVFNFLGPLTNPARAEMQVVGTSTKAVAMKLAHTLARLGLHSGFVVSGADGLGEVTVSGPTSIFRVLHGSVVESVVTPADFHLPEHALESIQGGDATYNSGIIQAVLDGVPGAARDVVVMNAALALIAAGLANDYAEAARQCERLIDTGAASERLIALRNFRFNPVAQ